MPLYTYRREDGTTFDIRQSFNDEPLVVDPETGQHVVRIVQAAPIIFKGSGFYVNDSRGKSNSTLNTPKKEKSDSTETTASTSTTSTTSESTKSTTSAAAD